MGRVIHTNSVGRQRAQLLRLLALALREMSQRRTFDDRTRDLAAFVVLALREVSATVETAVRAWERRDYWVKADQFRMQWNWTDRLARRLEGTLRRGDWESLVAAMPELATKLAGISLPQRREDPPPWAGAWAKLQSMPPGEEAQDLRLP